MFQFGFLGSWVLEFSTLEPEVWSLKPEAWGLGPEA
jgi:hypothetical protein